MKKIVLCILLILLICADGLAQEYPDWLEGTLCIDLYGADTLEESWPLDRFVCAFDFDNKQTHKIKIPSEAIFSKVSSAESDPIIIWPTEYGDIYFDSYSVWRWREVAYAEIIQSEIEGKVRYNYGDVSYDFWTREPIERSPDDNNVYSQTARFEAPMRILAIDSGYTDSGWPRAVLYYLQYGVSSEDTLEIQLVRNLKGSDIDKNAEVLYHFPIDYDFGVFKYAVSENGKVVWIEDGKVLRCADGQKCTRVAAPRFVQGSPEWYDDTTVLFFDAKEYCFRSEEATVLKSWNITTRSTQDFTDKNGQPIKTDLIPFALALSPDKSILAVYGRYTNNAAIQLIHLSDGESYLCHPWPNRAESRSTSTQWYGYATDGTVHFSPMYELQPMLAWIP